MIFGWELRELWMCVNQSRIEMSPLEANDRQSISDCNGQGNNTP
jgi:hypothetical protein